MESRCRARKQPDFRHGRSVVLHLHGTGGLEQHAETVFLGISVFQRHDGSPSLEIDDATNQTTETRKHHVALLLRIQDRERLLSDHRGRKRELGGSLQILRASADSREQPNGAHGGGDGGETKRRRGGEEKGGNEEERGVVLTHHGGAARRRVLHEALLVERKDAEFGHSRNGEDVLRLDRVVATV